MPVTKRTCPCGSGKPYMECCGASEKCVLLDQFRWRRAGRELRRKLGEFADQPSLSWDAARAQDMYLSCMDEKLMLQEDDFTMERCFEWFIFDFYLAKGVTVIEKFRNEYPRALNYYEKTLLEEWVQARISLYEVVMVLTGKGLIIKDLLNEKKITVHDVSAAAEIKIGNILLIRALKVGDGYEFSTSGLALPHWCKDTLLKKLTTDRERCYKRKKKTIRGWDTYLKDRSHKINAWVMELGTESSALSNDFADLQKERYSITFPLQDWQSVLRYIKNSREFIVTIESKGQQGDLVHTAAAWLGESRGGAGLQLVRGKIILTKQYLVIIANSQELLKAGKRLYLDNIASHANSVSKTVSDTFTWPAPGYAAVAVRVKEGLESLGFDHKQQQGAMRLWFDYCSKEQPAIRKTAVWAATVIYAFTRLEKDEELKQQDLAGQYGVSSSTISHRYKLLCRSLELVAYDKRYTTKTPILKDCRNNQLS